MNKLLITLQLFSMARQAGHVFNVQIDVRLGPVTLNSVTVSQA